MKKQFSLCVLMIVFAGNICAQQVSTVVGKQIVACQRVTGGWPKNIDMVSRMSDERLQELQREQGRTDDSTIDNGATTSQMTYLARLYQMTGENEWKEAFLKGLRYLLNSQYANGGWPQYWPNPKGYYARITFNDNAMVHVMTMMKDIMEEKAPFGGKLVDEKTRYLCNKAFSNGLECILKCQIKIDGEPTVWCQQHDENTFAPANARSYELASFCSSESAGIVELLMSVANPDERVKRAVDGAMRWFERYKLGGNDIWARFYDLEHCEPFFCDRDGIPKKHLSEIGEERRNGYSWYSQQPAKLREEYEVFKQKTVPYSLRMVESEMKRTPKSYLLDFSSKPKWSYVMGVELDAMLDVWLRYGGEDIWKYIAEYPETMIDSLGNTIGYKYDDFNLDNIRPARFILRMDNLSPVSGGKKALAKYFSQMENQPRTSDGPFWHKKIYHDQVWLDGIYMGLPFYSMYVVNENYNANVNKGRVLDDVVNQMLVTDQRTYDEATGLWKHAYDEKHKMFWADKTTGRSQHSWARAMGWYVMAMVEVLDVLPEEYGRRGEVVSLFRKAMDAVVRYRDRKSGVWYDVLDVNDERNYTEATASCMFTYCLLKGTRLGYLDGKYLETGIDAYNAVIRNFVKENPDGTISLTRCCSVSGLGPESNPKRDGTFEYYMSEPIRDNDAKGVGPFIWASLEMERLTSAHKH